MSVTLPRLMLVACVLFPSLSWALGLGEIHLQSSLNEPMKAEIDLLAATPDELNALHATLAPREAFTRYGIDRPAFLSSLTFKVAKSKDGRDVLQVSSADAIPEPFVTFLVDVNWARGRLMREYTVLLDPPVYSPGERASSSAPVSAATSTAPAQVPTRPASSATSSTSGGSGANATHRNAGASASGAAAAGAHSASSYRVAPGDTLMKIVRSMRAGSPADLDQTMIAVYRANPDAFGGNINVLKRGAVLRIPGADEVAALNQSEAMSEVHRQMSAWHGADAEPAGHLRLVTPGAGSGTGTGAGSSEAAATANAESQALRTRVKDLESQLTESKRLLDVRSNELADLQHKLSAAQVAATKPSPATPVPAPVVSNKPAAAPPSVATPPPAAVVPPTATAPVTTTATPTPSASSSPPPASAVAPPAPAAAKPPVAASQDSGGSWIDWVAANWWLPVAVILALIAGLAVVAWRKRKAEGGFPVYEGIDGEAAARAGRREESFVVEESGEHPRPAELVSADPFAETADDLQKAPEDTISSEGSVSLDQGDPLAEADFHMAYGLYDQAADLVRIALEREPDRRDLRMKLLEIYFVWGNKEQFLQTAKGLEATRDQAPAGEWDKVVIMGKQIAPEEPMFQATGGGRGAGALVDLNLEGGENRVDIDLFGEPEGERSDGAVVKNEDSADTGESPRLHRGDADLDFTLDAPERGADESPTREMPHRGDEPTVESPSMGFHDAPTQESPTLANPTVRDRFANLTPKTDQTAEVSLDDLGLDLESLEHSDPSLSHSSLAQTDHPSDAPTMLAGLDEESRALMEEADSHARTHDDLHGHDQDLTDLERELEASFVAELMPGTDDSKTAILGPESGPTLQMPRNRDFDTASTSRFTSPEFSDVHEIERGDTDSTSKLRGLDANSIDLDLDRLANQLGQGDTVEQPRSDDEIFSAEVFDATTRSKGVDLDVGDMFDDNVQEPTNRLKPVSTNATQRISPEDSLPELEPVTMSEVGTKLDLARAYMDMGDPEGARSILEEVVNEGSASQKQEAQRLIEALPG